MGLVLLWFSPLWLAWMVVMLFIGKRHPPTLADHRPVGRARILVGLVGLVVFALCFTPKPLLLSWNDFINSFAGVAVRAGSNITGQSITVTQNNFTNNLYDIRNLGTGTVAARKRPPGNVIRPSTPSM